MKNRKANETETVIAWIERQLAEAAELNGFDTISTQVIDILTSAEASSGEAFEIARRFADSVEIVDGCVEYAEGLPQSTKRNAVKAGDMIVSVCAYDHGAAADGSRPERLPSVSISRPVTVKSLGKRQGTATRLEDGKYIRSRIYRDNMGENTFLVDDEIGIAAAVEREREWLIELTKGSLNCGHKWALDAKAGKFTPHAIGWKRNQASIEFCERVIAAGTTAIAIIDNR